MSHHTAVWQELNESQREYYRAISEQTRVQERFMPVSRDRSPGSPVRLPAALTLEAIEDLATVDREVHQTRQRYERGNQRRPLRFITSRPNGFSSPSPSGNTRSIH